MKYEWSKPNLNVEILKRAVQKAKQNSEEYDIPSEYFGKDIEFNQQSNDFNATVGGKDVILQDGWYQGDNTEIEAFNVIRWSGDTHRQNFTEPINFFMLKVSKFYGEEADGDVLEWKVKSKKPYNDDEDKVIRYVVSVSPYAIDWDSEYIDVQSNSYAGTVKPNRN